MAGTYHLQQNMQRMSPGTDNTTDHRGMSSPQQPVRYSAAPVQPQGGIYQNIDSYSSAQRQPVNYPGSSYSHSSQSAASGHYAGYSSSRPDVDDFPPPPPPIIESPPGTYVQYPCHPLEGARSTVLRTAAPVPSAQGFVESRASTVQSTLDGSTNRPAPATRDQHRVVHVEQPQVRQSAQQPQGRQKEAAEVDALTSLLVKNMQASADPDFYGMCGSCGQGIIGEKEGCSALDQVFHSECFTCKQCGTRLAGQAFFALEGKMFCEPCYLDTLEKCCVCKKAITDRILRATGKPYHPGCFTCVVCNKSLVGIPFTVDASNQKHCIEDFHRKFAPRCCVCNKSIMPQPGNEETVRIVAMDKSFHVDCYRCEDCHTTLSSEADGRGCYPLDEHILCKSCNARRIQNLTTKMTTDL